MKQSLLPAEGISEKIYLIRDLKVMLSHDLAKLFEVKTKALNQAFKRNINRFPDHFCFQLTNEEYDNVLRSQNVTLKQGEHTKYMPYAYTEHGILMLSQILRSRVAEQMGIYIVDLFVEMRNHIQQYQEILNRLSEIESKLGNHDKSISQLFEYLNMMTKEKMTPRKAIGYKLPKNK